MNGLPNLRGNAKPKKDAPSPKNRGKAAPSISIGGLGESSKRGSGDVADFTSQSIVSSTSNSAISSAKSKKKGISPKNTLGTINEALNAGSKESKKSIRVADSDSSPPPALAMGKKGVSFGELPYRVTVEPMDNSSRKKGPVRHSEVISSGTTSSIPSL